jgi:hypothetical protein
VLGSGVRHPRYSQRVSASKILIVQPGTVILAIREAETVRIGV